MDDGDRSLYREPGLHGLGPSDLVLREDVGDIRFEIVRVIRRGGPGLDETVGWAVLDLMDVDLVDANLAGQISLEAVHTREEAEAEARRLAAE